jgi:hypothetical protein
MAAIVRFGARSANPMPCQQGATNKNEQSDPQLFFRHAFIPGEV